MHLNMMAITTNFTNATVFKVLLEKVTHQIKRQMQNASTFLVSCSVDILQKNTYTQSVLKSACCVNPSHVFAVYYFQAGMTHTHTRVISPTAAEQIQQVIWIPQTGKQSIHRNLPFPVIHHRTKLTSCASNNLERELIRKKISTLESGAPPLRQKSAHCKNPAHFSAKAGIQK